MTRRWTARRARYETTPPGLIAGRYDRRYRMVGCVLRNNGGPDHWQPIVDNFGGHQPLFVDGVTTDANGIYVDYSSAQAGAIVSVMATVDEALAKAGYQVGTSVTPTRTTIHLRNVVGLGDYVYYNGTSWVSNAGVFRNFSYASGVLTMSHNFVPGNHAQLTGRGATHVPVVSSASSAADNTTTKIEFRDWAGGLVTTPDTNMRVYVHRPSPVPINMDPRTVTTTLHPASNIWLLGLVEV